MAGTVTPILDDEGNAGIESAGGSLRYPNLSTFAFGWTDPLTVDFRTKFDGSFAVLSNLQFDGSDIRGMLVEIGYGGRCAFTVSVGTTDSFFGRTSNAIGDSGWHSVRVRFEVQDFVPDTPVADYSGALRVWIDGVEVPLMLSLTGNVGSATSCVSNSDILLGEYITGVPTGIRVSDLKVYSEALATQHDGRRRSR